MSIPDWIQPVRALYGRHPGEDIYIVGTGASMRVFPTEFLQGKITIGLNMAWKIAPIQYGITMRPDLNIPEFLDGETAQPDLIWVTKYPKLTTDAQRQFVFDNQRRFYNFRTDGQKNTKPDHEPSIAGRMPEWAVQATEDYLYMWSSISQTAVNLAANMGAKNIILVGCDNCALGGNHHAHNQHTLWKGADPNFRYHQYYEGLREVRSGLMQRGINLLNLTPFAGIIQAEEDFEFLCKEKHVETYIENPDISSQMGYSRLNVLKKKFFSIFR